jgi:ribose transport system ATP-binding protein
MKEVLLRLEHVDKSFSGVTVLDNVTIELRGGTVLGLVGENGAGKSTLMNILGGILPKDAGRMELNGNDFSPSNPTEASRRGIVFIHQELNLFTNLSVAENIFAESFPRNGVGSISYKKMNQEARRVLEMLGERVNPRALAGDLPMGTRQMVEISKALTGDAKIIIFDEPTTSLSTKEKERLFSIIKELAQKDVSIIYISHMLDDVFLLCDEIAVLRDGKLIAQQYTVDLTKGQVIKMMVGRELSKLFPFVQKNVGQEVLRVENMSQGKMLHGVSILLREGEIVGLFGLMGAGRSEFVKALYGVDEFDAGSIFFKGKHMPKPSPAAWIRKGVALITENRREEGLLMPKSVKDNLVLAHLEQIKGPLNSVNVNRENTASDGVIEKLRIRTYDKNRQQAIMLSGGNQQKTVIGKWLLTQPKVFLLDEPTRGIDVGAKYELYNHINDLAQNDSAILFISSEMEELMGVCDRILVMCRGRIAGELRREDFDQEKMLKLAIEGAA